MSESKQEISAYKKACDAFERISKRDDSSIVREVIDVFKENPEILGQYYLYGGNQLTSWLSRVFSYIENNPQALMRLALEELVEAMINRPELDLSIIDHGTGNTALHSALWNFASPFDYAESLITPELQEFFAKISVRLLEVNDDRSLLFKPNNKGESPITDLAMFNIHYSENFRIAVRKPSKKIIEIWENEILPIYNAIKMYQACEAGDSEHIQDSLPKIPPKAACDLLVSLSKDSKNHTEIKKSLLTQLNPWRSTMGKVLLPDITEITDDFLGLNPEHKQALKVSGRSNPISGDNSIGSLVATSLGNMLSSSLPSITPSNTETTADVTDSTLQDTKNTGINF